MPYDVPLRVRYSRISLSEDNASRPPTSTNVQRWLMNQRLGKRRLRFSAAVKRRYEAASCNPLLARADADCIQGEQLPTLYTSLHLELKSLMSARSAT